MTAPVFWREATPEARRALIAASLGWMLDAFDIMLFALVLPELRRDFGMSTTTAGILVSLTLVASAFGGIGFGVIADRYGRTRALILSVLMYSVFTAACGFATEIWHLAVFRVLLGLGMGGEWASGAALVAETWPAKHRGKALGLMQSAWAIGYALAALTNWLLVSQYGWRAVFFVGILPAFFTLWIRRSVKEPEAWHQARREPPVALSMIARGPLGRITLALVVMNACTLFAYWGFNSWVPSYLAAPAASGGVNLGVDARTLLLVTMQIGTWLGYVTFGFVSDYAGRKRTYVAYLVTAAVLVFVYTSVREPLVLLALGPVAAFFATGYFSGFGAVSAELYPTAIRARAQGLTYNIGRIASAAAPWIVGDLAAEHGYGAALSITAAAFVAAAVCWIWIPETSPALTENRRATD
ncbi:MAG: MFS transporter [Acidobacteriota bacterium]|nr:MFS transporter [Acidobacteriota bacterium]